MYQNIHSIKGQERIADFRSKVSLVDDFDILVLTETWLSEEIGDTELGLFKFNVFRCDRSIFSSSKSNGGGVLIALKKNLKYTVIPIIDNSFEILLINVLNGNDSFIIGAVYVPPIYSFDYYNNLLECIQSSISDASLNKQLCKLILLGDYNIPGYSWVQRCNYSSALGHHINHNIREAANLFSNWSYRYKMLQLNNFTNSYGNTLDLVFTDFYNANIDIYLDPIFECDAAHVPLVITIPVKQRLFVQSTETLFDFKRADFSKINNDLNTINWPDFDDDTLDFNSAVEFVHDRFSELINVHVPKITINNHKFPKWYSKELKIAISNKRKFHKLYKLYKSVYYYNLFKVERSRCKLFLARDEQEFVCRTEKSLDSNCSKNFFKFVNSLDNYHDIPNSVFLNNEIAHDGQSIVELFAKKFGGVYRESDLSSLNLNFDFIDSLGSITFTESDILKCINDLDSSSAPGPDNVHPLFIKNTSTITSKLLTKLFNHSIRNGIYPDMWKLSFVTPLHKNGDRADVSNYRPINKYNVVAKMMDSLVYDKTYQFLRKFFVPDQHGFIERKSTVTNLVVYLDFITSSINKGAVVHSMYSDISKAFDLVNIDLLIRKLNRYGICGYLLKWFTSYLSNRKQKVKIKNFISTAIPILSGVGQGTHLGPLLFLAFINDVCTRIKYSKCSLFADDTKLYKAISSPIDCLLLQADIKAFNDWCLDNGLQCNISKCFIVEFGKSEGTNFDYLLGNQPLVKVDQIKDLGIIIDSNLTFKPHIDYICLKILKRINFIKRFTNKFSEPKSFRSLYFSYIYPLFTYGSLIWRPQIEYLKYNLEKLNHKFLRYTAYKIGKPMSPLSHDYSEIQLLLNIPTVESSMERSDVIFAYKIFTNKIDCPEILGEFSFHVPNRLLRLNDQYFYLSNGQLNSSKYSPITKLSLICNKYAEWLDIYNDSLSRVKNYSRNILHYS